jgi:cytochrome P450/NADPH-cytochrome P450 reductase
VTIVDPGTERTVLLRHLDVTLGTVIENRTLTAPGHPVKMHLEFALPEDLSYKAGDYLIM